MRPPKRALCLSARSFVKRNNIQTRSFLPEASNNRSVTKHHFFSTLFSRWAKKDEKFLAPFFFSEKKCFSSNLVIWESLLFLSRTARKYTKAPPIYCFGKRSVVPSCCFFSLGQKKVKKKPLNVPCRYSNKKVL